MQFDNDTLYKIIHIQTEVVAAGYNLGRVMEIVTRGTKELTGADGAILELLEGDEMVYRAASGSGEEFLGLRLSKETSLSGLCVMKGETLICIDSETDPRVDRNATRKVGLRSMLVVPIVYRDRAVGVLKTVSGKPGTFSELDSVLLTMMADLIAASISSAVRFNYDEIYYQAVHDYLTGLGNRSLFMDHIRQQIHSAREGGEKFGIVILDFDDLDRIAGERGLRARDALLVEIASRLNNRSGPQDTVARLGGSEFGILLHLLSSNQELTRFLNSLKVDLENPYLFEGSSLKIPFSAGACLFPDDATSIEKLMELAGHFLFLEKRFEKS